MPRALLVTTTVLTCLFAALGCKGEPSGPRSGGEIDALPSIILSSPPTTRAASPVPTVIPESVAPQPASQTPPVQKVRDAAPTTRPRHAPLPSAPDRSPSQYRDRCGRPLVA